MPRVFLKQQTSLSFVSAPKVSRFTCTYVDRDKENTVCPEFLLKLHMPIQLRKTQLYLTEIQYV